MKRKLSILIIILFLSSIFVSCSNTEKESEEHASQPKEINFGILRVPNDETIAIAEGLFDKYFTDKGIQCNYIIFDSGVDANKALASGSIDFATMGNTNAVIASALGLDVEMIWIHEVLGEIEALAVKNGSGIDTLEDLSGMKVATPFASTAHYSLLNALKNARIDDKVQLLDMQTPEIVAAWERGDIQAAYTWQPSLSNLLKNGEMLITSEDMANQGYITANVEVVRKEFANKYPDLVAAFILALQEAGTIYKENPEEGAAIVAEQLEISSQDALFQMQGSIWLSPQELLTKEYFGTSETPGAFATIMKDTADFLEEQGSIDRAPSQDVFNDYVNPYYIEIAIQVK